ncbi:MAG: ATP synthase subunit I [Deltaproteobacteria bacterium]|nr:ATP synthase subunit I [Deltaproteobacteria bacterium]
MAIDLDWKAAYREIKLLNWITLLILSAAGAVVLDAASTLGIILGGLVIMANFGLLQHTIRRAFSGEGTMTGTKASVIVKYYLRLLALGIVLLFLISRGWINPVGLAVGLSTVFISIVGFGIKRACKIYTREAT